jgi:hypothetical protein
MSLVAVYIFTDAKQDRQCAYTVTLRRVLATIVAGENHSVTYCVRVCSLR